MEKKITIKHKKKELDRIVLDITKYFRPFTDDQFIKCEFKLFKENIDVLNEIGIVGPYMIIEQIPKKNPLTKAEYLDVKLQFSIAELDNLIKFIKERDFKIKLLFSSLIFILNDDNDYLIIDDKNDKFNIIKKIK